MSIIASACEISYAEFDLENAEFTKAVNITNDGNYDLDPKVLVNDSNIYITVNGSLMGSDEYAVNLRKITKPSQNLIIYDEDRCIIEITVD